MKLMGKDITPAKVMAFVGERLAARGLAGPSEAPVTVEGVEPRVDPLSFNLHALEENADATRGLPLETHREGVAGRAVVLAKRVFRSAGQIFINEALGRQTVFNGHVRDSYAQLSAEVLRLRQRVAELEREARRPVEVPETIIPPVMLEPHDVPAPEQSQTTVDVEPSVTELPLAEPPKKTRATKKAPAPRGKGEADAAQAPKKKPALRKR
ncbi:MAG: hypothetical protein ACOZQL_43320 [Myxococcota bacterium]